MDFWKEFRDVNGSSNSISQCIDGVSAPSEVISIFEFKFMSVLNDTESKTVYMSTVSVVRALESKFTFTKNGLDGAVNKLNIGLGLDSLLGQCSEIYCVRFYNKMISHCFVPRSVLKGEVSTHPVTTF